MKKTYLVLLLFVAAFAFNSCTGGDENDYEPVSPVVLDVTQVPYAKLSDYHFFEGEMKNLVPAYRVLPFKPNSELFSDYARKKRFIWMPSGVQATYVADDSALDFPVGTVLIKNFYYDDVLPDHTMKIIETRLLVKTAEDIAESDGISADSGWKLFNYIWNDEQTEAFLNDTGNGQTVPISFVTNGVTKTTNYQIPSAEQCITCHKLNANHTPFGEIKLPLGVKPQNLNFTFDYGTSQQNQLEKWQATGYLDNSVPDNIVSTVDWTDTGQPLDLRARSYIDANCAHCHRTGAACDYTQMRFNFSNTDPYLRGICMEPQAPISNAYTHIIAKGNWNRSDIGYRMSATSGGEMMPLIGRTLVHEEGVALIQEWILAMPGPCE
jgi:uncharacterized repeat protein (TIGR03806 family)